MDLKCRALLLGVILLSGCAGLSQQDRDETAALKDLQKAHAKVERKTVKLGLATTASVAAAKGVITASKELKQAKAEHDQAKVDFCKVLDCTFPETKVN